MKGWQMSDTKYVTISVDLDEDQAWAYAQFLKRVCFSDYRSNAASDEETRTMIDAGERIRDALAEKGFTPR
jgi:hypothetical protein